MSKIKALSLISIFLLLFTAAYALEENFQLTTSVPNAASCLNSITTNSITVTNTGSIESYYTLTGQGTAPSVYSESSFSILPGQSKIIFVYLNPNSEGDFYIETTVKTTFGLEKTIKNTLKVQNCANIQLNAKLPSIKINPCTPAQFSFDVKNTGSFTENYEFGIKGLEGYTTLSTTSMQIPAGESRTIDLFINADCGIYGEKELKFQALATTSKFLAEADVLLDIQRNYDYSAVMQNQINICNLKKSVIPVSIKNDVPFVNQYDLETRAPSWLSQEAQRVELGPYGQGITNLIASPVNPGSFVISLKTTSIRGDVAKVGYQNITVLNCYDPDVNIENPSDIIVSNHQAQYKITVKNEGLNPDTYDFSLEGPEWVSANVQKTTLNPQESKTFILTALPGNNTGDFKAVLKLISNEAKAIKEDSISLRVINPDEAFDLKIDSSHTRILYGEEAVKISLENKGILPATYDLTLSSQPWATLTQNSISLKQGEKGDVYVQTKTNKEQEGLYETKVVANVRGEQIGYITTFNINLKRLTIWQELQVFVMKYSYFVIGFVVLLLVVIFIWLFGRRIARRWRAWRLKRKELAKARKELKEKKKQEKLARKLARKALRKQGKFWKRVLGTFMVIIALLLVIGGVLSLIGYTPAMLELFGQKQEGTKFEPIIKVDTANLEAVGNTVIIRGKETVIPIFVKNNYGDDLTFDVKTSQSWIETDTNEVTVEPGEQELIKLTVIPQEDVKGIYKIYISASLEKDNKLFKEDITLNIRQSSIWKDLLDYIWYMVCGLVVLVLGLIFRRKGKPTEKEQNKYDNLFSNKTYKPLKKIDIEFPRRK